MRRREGATAADVVAHGDEVTMAMTMEQG